MNVTDRLIIFLLLGLAFGGGGCANVIRRDAVAFDHKPLLIHFPGVAGDTYLERKFLSAVVEGGLDADTRLFDWTRKRGWVANLQAVDTNRATSRQMADRIVAFKTATPERPVLLTCDSGGAGPVLWTLEALPADVNVQGVLLLCPAISPDYDLSPALSRVRGTMVAFHGRNDGMVLDWGTRTFGTIDGKKVPAAGYTGFVLPRGATDAGQYRKLKMVGYDKEWFGKYGNAGDHTGALGGRFASGYIAPILIDMALGDEVAAIDAAPTMPTSAVNRTAGDSQARASGREDEPTKESTP